LALKWFTYSRGTEYGPYLRAKGFSKVDLKGYSPAKGDVVVIQNYKGGDVRARGKAMKRATAPSRLAKG
jgi:hypothetical protein